MAKEKYKMSKGFQKGRIVSEETKRRISAAHAKRRADGKMLIDLKKEFDDYKKTHQ